MLTLWTRYLLPASAAILVSAALAYGLGAREALLVAFPTAFAVMALCFGVECLRRVEAGDHPSWEKDLGGLGAEASGWRMSPSLAYLLAAAMFGIMAVSSWGVALGHPPHKPGPTATRSNGQDTSAASKDAVLPGAAPNAPTGKTKDGPEAR